MNDVTSAGPAAPAGDAPGAAAAGAADAAAVTPAPAEAAALADSTAASTAGGESTSSESSPSLLSSAAGKSPDQPAPAAEAKPDAKAVDSPDGQKAGEQSAKPDDPGKTEGKADAATDPAAKDATANVPPAQVSLEDLKLPDGIALDAEAGKAFVDLLNNGELAGKDRGQGLLDLHQKEIARVADGMAKHQRKVWDDLNAGWKDQLRKDPELGGNRLNTSLSMAKAVIEEFLSPEDSVALLKHTDLNGMGNYPPFVRLLHTLGKRLNVFEDSIVVGNPKDTPAKGPGNRGWYDKSLNRPGS
jgi:hypothetical protein